MSRLIHVLLLVFLIFSLAASTAAQTPEPTQEPLPVSVLIATDKTIYQPEEDVTIWIAIRNETGRELMLVVSDNYNVFADRVLDDGTITTVWKAKTVLLDPWLLVLTPFESHVSKFVWHQNDREGAIVPRGAYIIRGYYPIELLHLPLPYTIFEPTAAITLVGPQAYLPLVAKDHTPPTPPPWDL